MTQPYPAPVGALLTIGEPEDPWPDYPQVYGLSRVDIPELIRMVQDHDLRWQDLPDDAEMEKTEWYAQIHAWRALAQLGAVEAIPALINLFVQVDELDDEWWAEESREVFALLGPAAIEPLSAYLLDQGNTIYARISAGESLEAIALRHLEARQQCVDGIVAALKNYPQNDETINGFLVANLVKLKAVEQVGLIEEAFQADRVDDFVIGDFEDVQVEMGLLPERKTPSATRSILDRFPSFGGGSNLSVLHRSPSKAEKKKKKKRKQEKQSRQKNRKKK